MLQFYGALVKRTESSGTPLMPKDMLIEPYDYGFLTSAIEPGKQALTVPAGVLSGSDADMIWPGDRIDVILTEKFPTQRLPGRDMAAETVASNIRILAVNDKLAYAEFGNSSPDLEAKSYTLEVTAEQAKQLVLAQNLGQLSLVVLGLKDPGQPTNDHIDPIFSDQVSPLLTDRDADNITIYTPSGAGQGVTVP
jgi:pilus assembly protein CpaB